jgi:hypothetical protein
MVAVDGALPRERLHSLLTVPGVLVPQDELEEHWQGGIAVYGYPSDTPSLWEGCSEGTFRTKGDGEPAPTAVFVSFVIYIPINCTALGIGDPEEFAERAAEVLRATQAFAVEQALSQGVVGLDNPFLSDVNVNVLATGVTPVQGIAYLERAIAETGRQGLIHITPSVASSLQPFTQKDDPTEPLYTGAGTPIAVGAGYVGADAGTNPDTNSDWIFASGPVHVRIEDNVSMVPDNIAGALDRGVNDVVYRAEKVAVVSWDTALQAAVLVDWAT